MFQQFSPIFDHQKYLPACCVCHNEYNSQDGIVTNFHSFAFLCSTEFHHASSSFALSLNSLQRILLEALGSSLSAQHLVVSAKSIPLWNSVSDNNGLFALIEPGRSFRQGVGSG